MFSGFDHIYCIHYLKYASRLPYIENELSRFGITSNRNFSWYYTCDNVFYDRLFEYMVKTGMIMKYNDLPGSANNEGFIKNRNVFNLAMNVFNLLFEAYYLGYEHILVLEDDIVFNRDTDFVKRCIQAYPYDQDIVSMEYWFRNKDDYKRIVLDKNRKINEFFYQVQTEKLVNFSCVGLSRRGIKHILDGMSQRFICSDYYIAHQNTFDDWRLKRAISRIPICVQNIDPVSNHIADADSMKWRYTEQMQLDLSQFYLNKYN